jgi:hypothetical protein
VLDSCPPFGSPSRRFNGWRFRYHGFFRENVGINVSSSHQFSVLFPITQACFVIILASDVIYVGMYRTFIGNSRNALGTKWWILVIVCALQCVSIDKVVWSAERHGLSQKFPDEAAEDVHVFSRPTTCEWVVASMFHTSVGCKCSTSEQWFLLVLDANTCEFSTYERVFLTVALHISELDTANIQRAFRIYFTLFFFAQLEWQW